jgi:hypothetical protein
VHPTAPHWQATAPGPRPAAPGWQPSWAGAAPAHKPGIVALRPLSLGDIVEGAFAAVRRNPRTFLGFAVLITLVVLVGTGLLGLLAFLAGSALEGGGAFDAVLALGLTATVGVVLFLSAATSIALTGILAYPVGEAVLGRSPSLGETWSRTRRMLPRLMGLCALLVVPLTLAFGLVLAGTVWAFAGDVPALGAVGVLAVLAGSVAAFWVGVRLALATPALVLEDLRVVAALRRSWSLTAGRFWRTLGILFVCNALAAVVQYVLSFVLQVVAMVLGVGAGSALDSSTAEVVAGLLLIGGSVVGSLVGAMATQPFLAAVSALLYTDLRIRKEGFDLALARAVAAGAAARR